MNRARRAGVMGVVCIIAGILGCGGPGSDFAGGEPDSLGTTVRFLRSDRPVPNQYIVVLRDAPGSQEVGVVGQRLASEHGGTVLLTYRHALRGFAARLSERQAIALSQDPLVQ